MDRRRSRSSSRSPRRKHRKHKHRSRRSRSRSRSRSGGRTPPPRIHVNPAFGLQTPSGAGQMGYSASQLLQHNNMLESEVQQLKTALLAEQAATQMQIQRNLSAGQEIRNLSIQRDNAQKRCNEVMNERRLMMDMKTEMANRLNGLEVANRQLRDEVAAANRTFEGKNQEIRVLTYQSEIVQQQITALNERNTALKAKCEATVGQNRQLQEELELKRKFLESANLNAKKAETDLQLANVEIQRLFNDLNNYKHLETSSHNEKRSYEDNLQRKDDEMQVSQYKSAAALKKANERIEELEKRLRTEKPAAHDSMTVETIYTVIETIKKTYEAQLSRLEEEVEALKTDRLKDHEHEPTKEQKEQQQEMEELPEYLQVPQKPDPMKMDELEAKGELKLDSEAARPPRPSSGPPVDSPVAWHRQKSRAHDLIPVITPIPLFGTTSTAEPARKEPDAEIHVELTEEDLLLAGPSDPMISPSETLELDEKQLLDEN